MAVWQLNDVKGLLSELEGCVKIPDLTRQTQGLVHDEVSRAAQKLHREIHQLACKKADKTHSHEIVQSPGGVRLREPKTVVDLKGGSYTSLQAQDIPPPPCNHTK